jgi:hypothetical protein
MKDEWVISVEVSVGVGGKWTCGESNIVEQVENGRGLDTVSDETKDDDGRPFKIGRGGIYGSMIK